jgi:hypothetical protein
MKTTFIVTCAVNTNIGIYDPSVRILQIHQTIDSIRSKFADANIILVDGGKPVTDPDMIKHYDALKHRCQAFLDMTSNEQIQHIHTEFLDKIPVRHEMGGTTGLTKSAAENIIMYNILHALKTSPDLQPAVDVDRIFKISGRYMLSPLFDASVYDTAAAQDKYVFKQREKSWMPDAEQTIGVGYNYSSRLWSFPAAKLDDCIERYEAILADCFDLAESHYVDIEHLLFKHMGPDVSLELANTHLMGTIAPNGTLIYD